MFLNLSFPTLSMISVLCVVLFWVMLCIVFKRAMIQERTPIIEIIFMTIASGIIYVFATVTLGGQISQDYINSEDMLKRLYDAFKTHMINAETWEYILGEGGDL